MEKLIGFFSSNARDLYIEDIYRALALPKGSIIHFRYDQQFIAEDIITNLNSNECSEGIIFFVTGNDLKLKAEEQVKEYHSIRRMIIKDFSKSDNTGLIHFYLELGDYCDYKLNDFDSTKFVATISGSDGIKNKWIDRVRKIKDHFEDVLFFNYLDFVQILNIENVTYLHP